MDNSRKISRYQLICLGFLAILSPAIRLFPKILVIISKDSAWITVVLSIIPAAAVILLSCRFFKNAAPDEGFAEVFQRILGKTLGKAVIVVISLWLIFYAAFSLCSSADRYIFTAYPDSSGTFFKVVLLFISAIPVFGNFRTLARCAQVFFPLMIAVLVLIFAFSVPDMDLRFISPVGAADWKNVFYGLPTLVNMLLLGAYLGFLEGKISDKEHRSSAAMLWLLLVVIVTFLLVFSSIAVFGGSTAALLDYPFFAMVRSIVVLKTIERMEAIVVALWVVSDFIFHSMLLFIITTALRRCFGIPDNEGVRLRPFALKNGTWLIWAVCIITLAVSLLIPTGADINSKLSQEIIPLINLFITFLFIPAVYLIGKLRKKI